MNMTDQDMAILMQTLGNANPQMRPPMQQPRPVQSGMMTDQDAMNMLMAENNQPMNSAQIAVQEDIEKERQLRAIIDAENAKQLDLRLNSIENNPGLQELLNNEIMKANTLPVEPPSPFERLMNMVDALRNRD